MPLLTPTVVSAFRQCLFHFNVLKNSVRVSLVAFVEFKHAFKPKKLTTSSISMQEHSLEVRIFPYNISVFDLKAETTHERPFLQIIYAI